MDKKALCRDIGRAIEVGVMHRPDDGDQAARFAWGYLALMLAWYAAQGDADARVCVEKLRAVGF